MLLTITTTHQPASDLGFLLHKHPARFQSFPLACGQAHVFYPEVSESQCTVALMLDIDPIGMVRDRKKEQNFLLRQYVNDRPYVASSFLSVAIAQVFGSAMAGRCKDRPELAKEPIPLQARIDVLPVRGGEELLHRMFAPLGYRVNVTRHSFDEQFPAWGDSPYYSVMLSQDIALAELLKHLYILMPVFDDEKHYFVGEDELEKLLEKGQGWLAQHPEREQISRRYLRHYSSLYRQALARLLDDEGPVVDEQQEVELESSLSLNEQRLEVVMNELQTTNAKSVLDLGCGEGKLLQLLMQDKHIQHIVGMDVSMRSLEIAHRRLKLDQLSERQREKISLIHGSLMYRDKRFHGFDAATVIEVIEHLDPPRLSAFERVVFQDARPKSIIVTTPNREYNTTWKTLPAGKYRHTDHRFEWTRSEFQQWAQRVAQENDYSVRFRPVGPEDEQVGSPTQMGVFERE